MHIKLIGMKAAMYYNNNDVRVIELHKPKISDDEVLIKAKACGVCGSDVMEWYRIKKAPLVLGHEMTGIIEEVGKNIKDYKKGQRVFVSHHIPCNKCDYCLNGHHTACELLHTTNYYPGGFAEFIRIPRMNIDNDAIIELPNNVSFEQGTFIEPLACVMRAYKLLLINQGSSIAIIGCGISGLLFIKLLKYLKNDKKKNKKVFGIDIDRYRLKKASEFGADVVINANGDVVEKIKENNDNKLADIVIVCTGAPNAAEQALKIADKGSQILFFAVPKPDFQLNVPINEFWRNQITIKTSYGASPTDLYDSLNLIKLKMLNVDDMVTHRLSLDQIQKGFNLVAEAKESLKVIIQIND